MKINHTVGVVIGRFQTPKLHEGHRALLNEVLHRHDKILVLLGVGPGQATERNPMDFATRQAMLDAFCPGRFTILPLRDRREDEDWCHAVDQTIAAAFPQTAAILYGARDSFTSVYQGRYSAVTLEIDSTESGTLLRKEAAENLIESEDFRAGIIRAVYTRMPAVYPTVDIAVLSQDGKKLLLAQKPGEALFRFPGGFVDPTDESLEAAAARELMEECGVLRLDRLQYAGSHRVDDWRYRASRDAVCTTLFFGRLEEGSPTPGDDIGAVQWFDLDQLHDDALVEEHRPLLKMLLARV